MTGLQTLGPAAVGTAELRAMVAAQLGLADDPDVLDLRDVAVEPVAYDLTTITTASRHWVRGHALAPDGVRPFSFFVKHIQNWSRSPLFTAVPEHLREVAAASVPWRTEALVYRSDLADHLPAGLTMPACRGVFDLDEVSAAIWLDEVVPTDGSWDLPRYRRAATLLGRMAAAPGTRERADLGGLDVGPRYYLQGRLSNQVLPMLAEDALWRHPLIAAAFDDALRRRLLRCADRAADLVEELAAMPSMVAHGDACPNNLLFDGDGFTLIDYGFWSRQPVGFDLTQLVLGEIQLGRRGADDLPELDAACRAGYGGGVRDEGADIDAATVARAHALKMTIFSGLSCLPWEHLDAVPTPRLRAIAADRARIAEFCLDRLARTD